MVPNYCAKEILHRNFRLGNSMIVIQISDLLLENSMVVIHICWNLDGCHMWRRKCSHDFITFGEFVISPIHCKYSLPIFVSLGTLFKD